RSSRGGTTGFYNQSDPNNANGQNTLSQRYDDPYFARNISRATAAGIYAGPYHFGRPDIVASTPYAAGIANTGRDEADHMLEVAGAFMRPGYLLPTFDLEAGQSQRTSAQLSAFAVEFSDRIYEATGIRPMVYTGQNYANYINSTVPEVFPELWLARWPNQSNPDAIDVQNGNPPPSPSTANVYGKWNPNHTVANPYPDGHPWAFWQYASTGRLQGISNGSANVDVNVANGGIEFVKDRLVPALWTQDVDGHWETISQWNSDNPGYSAGDVSTGPAPRLPGVDDWVIVDRPSADVAIDLTSGNHTIRKLTLRESLIISGGSLTAGYIPSWDSTPYSAEIEAPLSVTGGGAFIAHTLTVAPAKTLSVDAGTLQFDQLVLPRASATWAALTTTGDFNFVPFANADAEILASDGRGSAGYVDLGGALRGWNVADGGADVDLTVSVDVVNGGLAKRGAGALALHGLQGYDGDTIVEEGQLILSRPTLGDQSDVYVASGGALTLEFSGNDVVHSFYIDGVAQSLGVWGAVGSGAQFTSPFLTGAGFLEVTAAQGPEIQGDFDANGRVDEADLSIWQQGLGTTNGANWALGDADGDEDVDGADFMVWMRAYGAIASQPVVAIVPEPTSCILACTWAWLAAARKVARDSVP
ncbi:MAG: hypothetical protein KDA61_04960, partial [Planctomycetales bacterium]|nr:hypothetical protein [Planctomycetales bacterium]